MDVSDARKLKALEEENARLKKLLAEAMLDNAMLKDLTSMVTPAARREAVAHLVSAYEVSQRRACRAIKAPRSVIRYRHTRPEDAGIRTRLRELAAALFFGARGGMYIGGGIAPRILNILMAGDFRRGFDSKGRMTEYMKAIPIYVIVTDEAGLRGAAAFLAMTNGLKLRP